MIRRTARILLALCLGLAACMQVLNIPTASAHQPHDPIVSVAVSPNYAQDHTLFVGTGYVSVSLASQMLLKSTDGGLTWQALPNFPNYRVMALAVSPSYASDNTLYAATLGAGLLQSSDGGMQWTDIAGSLGNNVLDVALSPAYSTDHTIFAIDVGGNVFTSSTGGASWTQLPSPGASVVTLAFSPQYALDHTLFAGTMSRGVFKSPTGGTSWKAASLGIPARTPIMNLAVSPSYGTDFTVAAGTPNHGVYITKNAGITWSAANSGLGDTNIHGLALSPNFANDHTLFVGTKSGSVFRSTDSGQSWQQTATIPRELSDQTNVHDQALAISPNYAADQSVFVAMFEGLWATSNAGTSWQYSSTLPPSLVRSLSISPSYSSDHTVIASNYGGGMIRSTDGGASWQARNTNLINCYPDPTAIAPTYADGGTIFAGTGIGLEQAKSTGAWTLLPLLGVSSFVRAAAVSPNYGTDQSLAIATDNLGTTNPTTTTYHGISVSTDGLFLSTNGGLGWTPTSLNGFALHAVAFSPNYATDGTMLAGSLDRGVFLSTDRGHSWTQAPGTLGTCCVSHVAFSPTYASDHSMFASVPIGNPAQRGLYISTNSGASWSLLPASQSATILSLAISPAYATDHTIFLGTLEHGLLVSTNGGASFASSGLSDAFVTAVAVSPAYATDRTAYAATYQGIYRSTDGAATWRLLPTDTRYEEDQPGIIRTGSWTTMQAPGASCDSVVESYTPSDTLTFTFKGSQISWIGGKAPNYGIAQVTVDGVSQGTVDLYASSYLPQQTLFQSATLPVAQHTITIAVTGQHNPQSKGTIVTLDALVVAHSPADTNLPSGAEAHIAASKMHGFDMRHPALMHVRLS